MMLVYITCRDYKEARKISIHLLKRKLIGCANIFPIKSVYWWNNKIVNHKENAIIAKTNNKNFKKVANEVKKVHSYSIPCILRVNASANREYEDWLRKSMH